MGPPSSSDQDSGTHPVLLFRFLVYGCDGAGEFDGNYSIQPPASPTQYSVLTTLLADGAGGVEGNYSRQPPGSATLSFPNLRSK